MIEDSGQKRVHETGKSEGKSHPCVREVVELVNTRKQEEKLLKDDVETWSLSQLPLSINKPKNSLWTFPIGSAVHSDNLSHVTEKMSE